MITLNTLQQINYNEESAKETINENFDKVEQAVNEAVSTVTTSTMKADLDMGAHSLLNVKTTEDPKSLVTRGYLQDLVASTKEMVDSANAVYQGAIEGAETFLNETIIPQLVDLEEA